MFTVSTWARLTVDLSTDRRDSSALAGYPSLHDGCFACRQGPVRMELRTNGFR